ncbi:hypothetical protein LEN26_018224 [Aphanomyces euteiches]|nr:hypothetical protein LEN26_018224 [Aphanomyces euteiches]KAH9125603.1 hypothetical protein AeMF1_003817 [Aphanomyces euteiches]KAH9168407.1 hypothetical protein AeNC1_017938 [Aphanomyces euteiches]
MSLRDLLLPLLDAHGSKCEILVPGCGISALSFELYHDGFQNITNIDFSSVAIERMTQSQQKQLGLHNSMQFVTMDAMHMEAFPAACFDVILDKGLLDSLLTHPTENVEHTLALLDELYRIRGWFILVASAGPLHGNLFVRLVSLKEIATCG